MTYKLMIADDDEQSRITLANCFPWSQVGFEIVFQASDGLKRLGISAVSPASGRDPLRH